MQVNYKTISSLEFDVLTGTYKKVDKEVEDTSGGFTDNAFFELLMGINEGQEQGKSDLTTNAQDIFDKNTPLVDKSESISSEFTSNFYSLRFRQDEGLKAMEVSGQNNAEQLKNNLFSDLLSAL